MLPTSADLRLVSIARVPADSYLVAEYGMRIEGIAVEEFAPQHPRVAPDYLRQNYWWAYIHPNAVRVFERQWLVNLILWGNFARLRDAALDEHGPTINGRTLQVACVYGDFSTRLAERIAPSILAKGEQLRGTRHDDEHRATGLHRTCHSELRVSPLLSVRGAVGGPGGGLVAASVERVRLCTGHCARLSPDCRPELDRAPAVVGTPLLALFLAWVAGRLAVFFSCYVGAPTAAAIDLLFLATFGAVMAREIIAGGNKMIGACTAACR
jgi:hypothetical protein